MSLDINRIDIAKDKVSDLEGIVIKSVQNERQSLSDL